MTANGNVLQRRTLICARFHFLDGTCVACGTRTDLVHQQDDDLTLKMKKSRGIKSSSPPILQSLHSLHGLSSVRRFAVIVQINIVTTFAATTVTVADISSESLSTSLQGITDNYFPGFKTSQGCCFCALPDNSFGNLVGTANVMQLTVPA